MKGRRRIGVAKDAFERGEVVPSRSVRFLEVAAAKRHSDWWSSIDQGGAVPYRERADGTLEVCLMTSSAGLWGLPKGGIDRGNTAEQTAVIESFEEAGLVGTVTGPALGVWRYEKRSGERFVLFFPMRVHHEIDDWDEADRRDRRWVSAEDAYRHIERPGLDGVLQAFNEWVEVAPARHHVG